MQTYNKSYKQNTNYFLYIGIFKFILQEINIKASLRYLKVDSFLLMYITEELETKTYKKLKTV